MQGTLTRRMRDPWADLEPYGQLVSALVPRASALELYDAAGQMRWCSGEISQSAVGDLVRDSLERALLLRDEPGERLILDGAQPVYVFWLRSGTGEHSSVVAETACQAAKDRGRNRVEVYQNTDISLVRRYQDVNIVPNLRMAMNEGRLRLDAQLIQPLQPGSEASWHFELLLRMIDDEGRSIGPERFLSAAIRYQFMPTIDRWVIGNAIELLRTQASLLADAPVVFTVNLSGQSIGEHGFVDFLVESIQGSGLNPRLFCFELTESAAVGNLANAEGVMRRVRSLGCGVALDDFGTGLSSLAYLRSLPIDMLKIDGSFIRDILRDGRAESMVEAIAHLARAMKLTTVAEYVETDEIRMRVAGLGVDYGQGFAIARPMPLAEVLAGLPLYLGADAPARDGNEPRVAAR